MPLGWREKEIALSLWRWKSKLIKTNDDCAKYLSNLSINHRPFTHKHTHTHDCEAWMLVRVLMKNYVKRKSLVNGKAVIKNRPKINLVRLRLVVMIFLRANDAKSIWKWIETIVLDEQKCEHDIMRRSQKFYGKNGIFSNVINQETSFHSEEFFSFTFLDLTSQKAFDCSTVIIIGDRLFLSRYAKYITYFPFQYFLLTDFLIRSRLDFVFSLYRA